MPPETLAHFFNPELCLKEADRSIPQRWTQCPWFLAVWPVEAPARNQKDKDVAPCFITYQDHPRLAAPLPHPQLLALASLLFIQLFSLVLEISASPHSLQNRDCNSSNCLDPCSLSISCGLLMLFPNPCN